MRRFLYISFLCLCCASQAAPAPVRKEASSLPQPLVASEPAGKSKPSQESAESQPASTPTKETARRAAYPGMAIDPSWKKEVYVITDSVVLGAKTQLEKGLKANGYSMLFFGKPAIMLPPTNKEINKNTTLPEIAVVAVGYNTLWEKDRKNFASWSKRFDKQAETVYQSLIDLGVKKVVWVMLREISEDNVPMKNKTARNQLEKAGFYFPYVNERLKAMRERHPEMALADWPTAGAKSGYTYDAIHLAPKGAWQMTDEILLAIGLEPVPPEMKAKKKQGTEQKKTQK